MAETHAQPARLEYRPWMVLLLTLASSAILSVFSGYRTIPVPLEVGWQFSPLGLLREFKAEYLDYVTLSTFSGKFSPTFDYLRVFLATCLLESPFYALALRKQPRMFALSILLLANVLTHPIVFFLFPALFTRYITCALSAEFFAAFAEFLLIVFVLRRASLGERITSGLLVILANLFSWQMGIFV